MVIERDRAAEERAALAAVPAAEQVPGMDEVGLGRLLDEVRAEWVERARRQQLDSEVERLRAEVVEVKRVREAEQEVMRRQGEAEREAREERLCAVCIDVEKDTVFGCGHRAYAACAEKLTDCPICREPVTVRIKIF